MPGSRLAARLTAEEKGFTLIELVIVILILGVMVAIAVPGYVQLQQRADRSAAMTNVRAVTSDVEAYYADNGTFDGISADGAARQLRRDRGHLARRTSSSARAGRRSSLCSKSHGFYGFKLGPAALVDSSATAPSGCTL